MRGFFLLLLPLFLFYGCREPNQPDEIQRVDEYGANGIFVLNEGIMDHNNSTLTQYDFAANLLTEDIFLAMNNRGLGDTGNDLKLYGSKLYCVVNISSTIEVMDKNARSLKQISLAGKQPRHIDFYLNYAYVSCFDGSVLRIDTATLEVDVTAQAGLNPDGLCVANGKLYVANSGGLSSPNYDNSISVFSLPDLSLLTTIPVVINPTRVLADRYGDVYVMSNGNYNDIPATFQRINTQTDEVVQVFDFPVSNFAISDNLCYLYSYNYSTQESAFKVLDVETETVLKEGFIADGTSITTPYCIAVNPDNGDVYITDARNYTVSGTVYCFDADGNKRFSFNVGVNPSSIVFYQ